VVTWLMIKGLTDENFYWWCLNLDISRQSLNFPHFPYNLIFLPFYPLSLSLSLFFLTICITFSFLFISLQNFLEDSWLLKFRYFLVFNYFSLCWNMFSLCWNMFSFMILFMWYLQWYDTHRLASKCSLIIPWY
jgi:hypothetical protein